MKVIKSVSVIVMLLHASIVLAQTKSYSSKLLVRWTLEKFPIHYYIKPHKSLSTKAPLSTKTALYEEFNSNGEKEGLHVEMQKNLIYPHTIYYYRKGVSVYQAYYLPNSNTAYEIINKDLNDALDGPQIKKELVDGKLIQKTDNFVSGVDKAYSKGKVADKVAFDENGLLHGGFNWTKDFGAGAEKLYYSGTANHGVIEKLNVTAALGKSYENFKRNYSKEADEMKIETLAGDVYNETQKITKNLKITNSKSLAESDSSNVFYEDVINYEFNGFRGTNFFETFIYKMFD